MCTGAATTIVLLLFLQKQNLANAIYLFGLGTDTSLDIDVDPQRRRFGCRESEFYGCVFITAGPITMVPLCVFITAVPITIYKAFREGRGNGGHLLLSKSRREGKRPVVKLCSPYRRLFFFGITNTALPPLEPTGVLGI